MKIKITIIKEEEKIRNKSAYFPNFSLMECREAKNAPYGHVLV
jgi:hypothetical protein